MYLFYSITNVEKDLLLLLENHFILGGKEGSFFQLITNYLKEKFIQIYLCTIFLGLLDNQVLDDNINHIHFKNFLLESNDHIKDTFSNRSTSPRMINIF
jgi:hypothetical protein